MPALDETTVSAATTTGSYDQEGAFQYILVVLLVFGLFIMLLTFLAMRSGLTSRKESDRQASRYLHDTKERERAIKSYRIQILQVELVDKLPNMDLGDIDARLETFKNNVMVNRGDVVGTDMWRRRSMHPFIEEGEEESVHSNDSDEIFIIEGRDKKVDSLVEGDGATPNKSGHSQASKEPGHRPPSYSTLVPNIDSNEKARPKLHRSRTASECAQKELHDKARSSLGFPSLSDDGRQLTNEEYVETTMLWKIPKAALEDM